MNRTNATRADRFAPTLVPAIEYRWRGDSLALPTPTLGQVDLGKPCKFSVVAAIRRCEAQVTDSGAAAGQSVSSPF